MQLPERNVQGKLRRLNTILIPHGSFNAYLNLDEVMNDLHVPMFGNRELLHWEANRREQEEWLRKAGLRLPETFKNA
jgi:5-formaminoimidazole-4-carboxamide-1-(beta)-D-ribofuranosyl 5'-monophosphate synthetase